MARRSRKRILDREVQLVMQRRSEGATCDAIAQELRRSVSSIYRIVSKNHSSVRLLQAQKALVKMNESPMSSVLKALVDEISKNPEIESVIVNPKTRTCKLTVRRELELTV